MSALAITKEEIMDVFIVVHQIHWSSPWKVHIQGHYCQDQNGRFIPWKAESSVTRKDWVVEITRETFRVEAEGSPLAESEPFLAAVHAVISG